MVTVISTVPAVPAGDVATQVVVAEHDTPVAGVVPNLTEVVVVPSTKPVPVTVTTVPPARGPALGVMELTVGIRSSVKRSPVTGAELPPGVVTRTGAVPAVPDGVVMEQVVAVGQLMAVAAVPPTVTAVDPVTNPVPVTVTTVPPASGPPTGVMELTVGTGS